VRGRITRTLRLWLDSSGAIALIAAPDDGIVVRMAHTWDIRAKGRAWTKDEGFKRFELTPEKFEMSGGKLFWDHKSRLTLLALLLENVGADAAVRLGNPDVWRDAVRRLG
jgi:hypothetical protein